MTKTDIRSGYYTFSLGEGMKRVVGIGLGLAMVLGGQSVVRGDETAEQDGAYRLGEIIVSAEAESIVESAGTTYRVTAEQIKDQHARTLDEALQLVPGVVIREGAEGTPRIDVRGFRTRHVQLFMNGIPVRNTNDGQFDPTLIPAEIISEIKVTSGGGSVLYGAGGNGAVIDIITKSGVEGVHGVVGGETGEGNSYEGKASVFGSNGKVDFYASAIARNRDEFLLSDDFEPTKDEDGDERENSDRQRESVFGNLSYRPTDATTLGLSLSQFTGENGKPPVTNYDKNDDFTKKIKYERTDDLRSSQVQLGVEHETGGPLDFRGWAYYSTTDTEENGYDDETYTTQEGKNAFHEESETEIYGASTQALYHIGDAAQATLGLTAEEETWSSDADDDNDEDIDTYSIALEYERELTKDIGMVAGYGQHFNERNDGDDNDFSYLLGATYDMSDSTRFKLNHSRKIRFPSVKQLYGEDGNPDLDTEVTYNYEAGVEQQLSAKAEASLTGFIINAEDFIEKDEDDVTRNFQDLKFRGIETDLKFYPVETLRLRFAVTWLDSEDDSDDSDRDELQHRPEWTVNTEARYQFGFGLTAYGSIQHVADQYFYNNDATEKKKLNDITVVNMKLSQAISNTGVEIYGGVSNLFDEDYEESYGLPQPGRMFYAGVEYHF